MGSYSYDEPGMTSEASLRMSLNLEGVQHSLDIFIVMVLPHSRPVDDPKTEDIESIFGKSPRLIETNQIQLAAYVDPNPN